MTAFFEYIGNITYYLLFAAVAGMFAPLGKYRKYVSLVLGFILLLLMIQPLGNFSRDIPVTRWFSEIPMFADDTDISGYEELWNNHLRGSFETQLEAQLARLLSDNGFEIQSADFSYSSDFGTITGVNVTVEKKPQNERVPLIRIQSPQINPIRIGESDPAPSCPQTETVKNLISQFYNLPASHIYVEIRY